MQLLTNNLMGNSLQGQLKIPGDKSISHRAIMLGSLARGTTTITNFLDSEDCMCTLKIFQQLGVIIQKNNTTVIIQGNGISGLREPLEPIYFGNSGTTARLMIGLLSGLNMFITAYGDDSLSKRPMDRVIRPLVQMGARVYGRHNNQNLPLSIQGRPLKGITYQMPVKSAQVKSAILLAGLTTVEETQVIEKVPARNHTELMLHTFGAAIQKSGDIISVKGNKQLRAEAIHIPGDISSAAYFLVGALTLPYSDLQLKEVGLNKTRTGIIDVIQNMGANLQITNKQDNNGEVYGDISVQYSELSSTIIDGAIIPRLIDEIPIIALLATQATGTTIIRNAEELKVKETDRIQAVVNVLSSLGASIQATDDGMIIQGKTKLHGGRVSSYKDHRIAMMIVIASLLIEEDVYVDDITCIDISYPKFFSDLKEILV